MLKKLNCAALALAASTMFSQAQAGTRVTIEPNGFSPIGITVVSEDGKTWTKVENKQLLLNVTIGLGKTDESVMLYKIRQEWLPQDSTAPWQVIRVLDPAQATVDKNEVVPGSTENLTPAERTKILKGCNAKLAAGGSIHETHYFFYGVKVQLFGQFSASLPAGQANVGGLGGKYGNGTATVPVTCKGVIGRPGSVVAKEPKILKVTDIELFRSTYSHANSQPNPGTVCKKARWLVRLTTNKKGPVKFKLWSKVGDAPMTSKVIDAFAMFDGPGKYKAEYTEWTEVSKTAYVQAMAEDMTNPIGQSTGWKSITLHCSGPGGGGLADAPKPNNDGPVTQPLKVSGELTLADSAPNSDKPRPGQAVFKIWANKPGNTAYRLTCSGGRAWEGSLSTFKVAEKKYQAVGAQNFQITKTEQIGCALWSTSTLPNGVIALATKLFKIVKDNPNTAGNDKVAPDRKPQTGSAPKHPAKTAIKVAPLPKLTCAGGKISRNTCFCPRRTKQVKARPNIYRCVKTVDAAEHLRKAAERLKLRQNRRQKFFGIADRNDSARPAVRRDNRASALGRHRFMR